MDKTWIIKEQGDEKVVQRLAKDLDVEVSIANLMAQRGIKTFDEAKTYFRPQLSDLYDPFLMKDMELAVQRIESAIKNKEKILIYGDYDVDGTTSVALMYLFLKKLYDRIDYYVPDRYTEGYGISYEGIDFAAENGFSLVIALDCGIKAVDRIAYANKHNIDFIICDHHTIGSKIPKAYAVLDPKRKDCKYPFNELSGCGVGFKLIHAYSIKNNIPFEEIVPYLDLVVVSIASDIVPVIDENRILAYYGLKQINENPRKGLQTILSFAGIENREITVNDIVFKIGPRINASGRISSGKQSVDLLISEDDSLAQRFGDLINDYNITRRNIDGNITQEALSIIENKPELQNRKSTVLFNKNWHKGVIGIVASRMLDYYYKPTVILTESNGFATGSARSVVGFDLYQAIDACSDLLENFGGHTYAAGLTLRIENIPLFEKRFEKYVTENILPEQLIPQIEIDAEIKLKDVTSKFYRIVNQFQPFGPGNMAPVFITENVVDNGSGRPVGSNNEHLKLSLIQEEDPFNVCQAIAFGQVKHYEQIKKGVPFDICYVIDENNYRGNTTLQLRIKDIKID